MLVGRGSAGTLAELRFAAAMRETLRVMPVA